VDLGPNNVRTFAVATGIFSDPIPGLAALNSPQISHDSRILYSAGTNTLDRVDLLRNTVSRSPLNHCGRILFSADGSRLYTARGVAYLNAPNLPYAGTLLSASPPYLLAEFPADVIAVASSLSNEPKVELFNQSHLRRIGQLRPQTLSPRGGPPPKPLLLFLDEAGTRVYTISLAPGVGVEAELTLFGVVSIDLTARPPNCILSSSISFH